MYSGNKKTPRAFELEKIIMGDNIDIDKLLEVLPEISILKESSQYHPAHCYDVLEHTIKVVERLPKEVFITITALFHDIGKPISKVIGEDGFEHFWGHEEQSVKIARDILNKLGYEDKFIKRVTNIIKYHDIKINPNQYEINKMISTIGREDFKQLIIHKEADLKAHSQEYYNKKISIINEINELYEKMQGYEYLESL